MPHRLGEAVATLALVVALIYYQGGWGVMLTLIFMAVGFVINRLETHWL